MDEKDTTFVDIIYTTIEKGMEAIQLGSCRNVEELVKNLNFKSLEGRDSILVTEFSPSSKRYKYTLFASNRRYD